MLRAYIAHPTRWSDVIDDIKANSNHLNEPTRELYRRSTVRQLRDRLSAKLSNLMAKAPGSITNGEISNLVRQVRDLETRHVDRNDDANRREQPNLEVDEQVQPGPLVNEAAGDVRDEVAANLSASSSDEGAPDLQDRPRGRKRPLSQLIRENQEMYNNFMKRKMPKILREIGISTSEESE